MPLNLPVFIQDATKKVPELGVFSFDDPYNQKGFREIGSCETVTALLKARKLEITYMVHAGLEIFGEHK